MRERTAAVFITFHHLSRGASYTGLAIIALVVATLSSSIFARVTVGLLNLLTRKSCLEMYAFCVPPPLPYEIAPLLLSITSYQIPLSPPRDALARARVCKLPEHHDGLIQICNKY